jgi:hypothetical protein
MACACNSNKGGSTAAKSYVVSLPGGGKKTYRTEVEAIAAAKRLGGTWKAQ